MNLGWIREPSRSWLYRTLDERNIITKSETRRWDITTHTSAKYFFLSKAWKNSTPHAVCRRMKHSVVRAEVRKNRFESPWRPTVPGPVASARTLTREKVPLMMPKPKPETEINQKKLFTSSFLHGVRPKIKYHRLECFCWWWWQCRIQWASSIQLQLYATTSR